jgi:hypothetical protein
MEDPDPIEDRTTGNVMIRRQPASVKSQLNSIEPELMSQSDEPLFDEDDIAHGPVPASDPAVRVRIRHLLDEQPYAVLCVQGGGQPYGALVAVAFSADLQHAVFSTPIETRKYRLLSQCSHVALVIDDRSKKADVSLRFEALVLQGRLQNISTTGVDSRGQKGTPGDSIGGEKRLGIVVLREKPCAISQLVDCG